MKIKNHTITITPDELDTLGMALEMYLEHEMKTNPRHFEMFEEDAIDLLGDFTQCGYSMWLDPIGRMRNGKSTTDVDEWIKYTKKKIAGEKSKDKKKKGV